MKRLTTMVFAALVAVVLSVPAFAQPQNNPPATNSQSKTANKQSKEEKKEAAKSKKAEKKSKKQASKDKKEAKPATK
jgi:sugar phosphate permease